MPRRHVSGSPLESLCCFPGVRCPPRTQSSKAVPSQPPYPSPTTTPSLNMLTRASAGFRLGSALSRQCRLNSTTSKPLSSRSQVAPTTFSEKASPRNVHDRPEQIRGFPVSPPPRGVKTDGATPRERPQPTLSREEAFDGPSKPRMMYARQSQRELPDFKVGRAVC